MSLQITEILSKFSAYEHRLDNMSFNNISKFETAMKEHEEIVYKRIYKNVMTSKLKHIDPPIRNYLF